MWFATRIRNESQRKLLCYIMLSFRILRIRTVKWCSCNKQKREKRKTFVLFIQCINHERNLVILSKDKKCALFLLKGAKVVVSAVWMYLKSVNLLLIPISSECLCVLQESIAYQCLKNLVESLLQHRVCYNHSEHVVKLNYRYLIMGIITALVYIIASN